MLAGTNAEKILVAAVLMMEISRTWNNPFGNGDAAHRIIEVCKKRERYNDPDCLTLRTVPPLIIILPEVPPTRINHTFI